MIRLLHVVAIACLVGSAGYAYSIKYETLRRIEQLAQVRTKIQRERDMIAVLKAEWQLLNRPDRLQGAADRHLDLQPISPHQLARLSDLPMRPDRGDEIARKLDALLMAEPTATPKDKRASEARTPALTPTRTSGR